MISKSFSPKFCKVDFMQKKSFIQSPGSHENSRAWICMQIFLKVAKH